MPRKKPIKKLDVIGLTDCKPYEAVGEYTDSKAQDEFFVKPPNWDSAGDSIELLHVQHAREHEAMLKSQQIMLVENERMANLNKHRTAKLYQTQAHLRQRFIEANSFIKEISEKADKDKKCAEKELALHEELRSGIEKFRKSIDELGEFREKFKQTVEEFQPYERVMDEVLEKSDLFESTKDCMTRIDSLLLAQFEISSLTEQKKRDIELMRHKITMISKEISLKILGVKTDLNNMMRSYLEARDQCAKWENKLRNAKILMTYNDCDKSRTREGVQILYGILCKRKEMEKMMDFIKDEMEILSEIADEHDKRTKSESDLMAHKKC